MTIISANFLTIIIKLLFSQTKFILGFSYNSFQNIVRVLPTLSEQLRRLDPSLPNSVEAYKRDIFQIIASENSREALGARNAFNYVDIGRVRGFEPKSDSEI